MSAETKSHSTIEIGSNRSFGLVFAAVFVIVALWPLLGGNGIRIWASIIAIGFLAVTFVKPEILAPLNRLWFRFGLLLGKIVAPIVMGLIYFIAVVPTGLLLRLARKDVLLLKIDPDAKSYWIDRDEPAGSMKDQF